MVDKMPTSDSLVLDSCEPSPDSCLQQHAQIRILYLSNITVPVGAVSGRNVGSYLQQHQQQNYHAPKGLGVEVSADTEGGPLRGRVLSLLRERTTLTHEDVKSGFPAASEYFSAQSLLHISVEDDSASNTSVWENMLMYKRIGAVLTVINGSCATAKQQIASVKAVFQQKVFASIIRRCIVFEGSDDLMSTVDRGVFKSVGIATAPLATHVNNILLGITSEIIHFYTHRVRSLQISTTPEHVTTPMDRLSGKTVDSKIWGGRSAKQQGDILLQLGATSAALQAYSKATNLDPLWTAATLEAVAAARYLDNQKLFNNADRINKQLLALCAGNRDPHNIDLNVLEEIVNLAGTKLELISKTAPLPPTIKQRLASEVEASLTKKLADIRPKISQVKELFAANSDADGDSDILRTPLSELQSLYAGIIRLSYAELELYLSEAYFLLPTKGRAGPKPMGDSVQLLGLEIELLLKLANIRAEQKNAKALLECIGTINGALRFLGCYSAPKELMIARKIPDLCYECGCCRKAIYYLQQSAANDREGGRIQESLQSLLKACRWCSIPIAFDALHGGLMLERDFTINSSTTTTSSVTDPSVINNNSAVVQPDKQQGSVRIQVSLLLELLSTLRSVQDLDETQWGLACHVSALLMFKFYDYIDDVGQSKLNFILQTCSVTLPMHLRPTIVSPPLIKGIAPLALPPHLSPQSQHVGGVKFIRFNTKAARFCFDGEIMKSHLIWVCGEVSQVQLQITNPFRNEIQLSSIAIKCRAKDGRVGAATSYVTHGALLAPHATDTIAVSVLPQVPGILLIEGVEVRIGQSGFKNPISILTPVVEVPVLGPLPLVLCSFNVDEVEVFARQQYVFTTTVHNIGAMRVDQMVVTLHRDDCGLQGCEGCLEKGDASVMTASIDRSPLASALPFAAMSSVALKAIITPPATVRTVREEFIIARVEYSQNFEAPRGPNDKDNSTPTYAPVPKRTHDARLRVFQLPSVEVFDISISADRRYIEAQLQCLSDSVAIVISPNDKVPFERHTKVPILPRQYTTLRFVIARIPVEHRKFSLQWFVQDRPDVHGVLPLDFTEHLEHVRCTEPLEEVVVLGTLLDDQADRSSDPSLANEWPPTDPQISLATSAMMLSSIKNSCPPSWMSFQANPSLLYPVTAVQPIRFRITVTVPWQTIVPLDIHIHFDSHDDGAVIAGPTSTRWMLGAGCDAFEEDLEMYLFSTGEHCLRITIKDEEMREIRHSWVFLAEHDQGMGAGGHASGVEDATNYLSARQSPQLLATPMMKF